MFCLRAEIHITLGKSLDFLPKSIFPAFMMWLLMKKWVSEKLRCLSDLNQSLNFVWPCLTPVHIVLTILLNIKSPYSDWFRSLRHMSFSETHFFYQKSHHERGKNRFRQKIQGFAQRNRGRYDRIIHYFITCTNIQKPLEC